MRRLITVLALLWSLPALGQIHITNQKEGALRLGHYSSGDGMLGFVLDRTGKQPLLRYDGNDEIIPLSVRKEGDRVTRFVTDQGLYVLEISRYGRMLAFQTGTRGGIPIGRDADAQPLRARTSRRDVVEAQARKHQETLGRISKGLRLEVDWKGVPNDSMGTLHDALDNTVRALVDLGSDNLGREAIATGIRKVRFVEGSKPELQLQKKTLTVRIRSADGVHGRLSSRAVYKRLEDTL